ncbi:hypothetical protein QBK99_25800 [Corticibacterium sp. UT-5YL-CI-8]|nr:hypothetical protein [Tianweitania sp. UT-5YL-CI-8]
MPTVRMPDGTFGIRASLGGGGGGGQTVFAPSLSTNVEGGSRGKEAGAELANNRSKQINAELDRNMAEFTIKHSRNGGMLKQGKFG